MQHSCYAETVAGTSCSIAECRRILTVRFGRATRERIHSSRSIQIHFGVQMLGLRHLKLAAHLSFGILCWCPVGKVAAQVYKCPTSGGSFAYQQEPCTGSASNSTLIVPPILSNEEKSNALEAELKVIDNRVAKKFPNAKQESFGKDRCRRQAGIASRLELIYDWRAPKQNAAKEYEACLETAVALLDQKKQEYKSAYEWESRQRNAQSNLPFPTVGMSAHQVRTATMLGKPVSVNATATARGRREQWVYEGGTYLYFDNGTLTTIQSRESAR